MLIKFECLIDDKVKYYKVKEKINFAKGIYIRENVRDLKNDFYAKIEVMSHGGSLYKELKESDLCKNISLGIPI